MKNQRDGKTIFQGAKEGDLETVMASVQKIGRGYTKVNAKSNSGYTPLMYASREGHLEIVEFLVEKNAHVDESDYDGFNALMLASSNGHYSIVKTLIEAGADINATNDQEDTAVSIALKKGYVEIADLLVKEGAYIDLTSAEILWTP